MTGFSVDTKLFQELGELLVSKESIALVELIKNAYDADATVVTVTGVNIGDAEHGQIIVADDGVGMDGGEFRRGFLTIAGRTKNSGDRRSPVFGRRYTGEKGVGRLASHKLGVVVEVQSRKAGPTQRGAAALPSAVSEVNAHIDWAAIEALETLDQIPTSGAVTVVESSKPTKPESGTTLTIAPLRTAWSGRMRTSFLQEAATLAPLPVTWKKLPDGVVAEKLLFDALPIRDQQSSDPGFEVIFGGDLSLGDQLLPDDAAAANWIAEISFDRDSGKLAIALAPTARELRDAPNAEGFRFEKLLGKNAGPSFSARILQLSNNSWTEEISGVRLFMEGFRVSPYGEPRNDWLGLDNDYLSRAKRALTGLARLDADRVPEGLDSEGLTTQGNKNYLGAVFLHRSSSPGLEMVVSREGFLPGAALDFIADWTRVAIDLIVRFKSLARNKPKEVRTQERLAQRTAANRSDVNETPTALRVRENAMEVERKFVNIAQAVERNDFQAAAREAKELQPSLSEIRDMADQFGSEAVQWRVLASLGTELAAFVHEINAVGLQISVLARDLEDALTMDDLARTRASIRKARQRALDLADRIRRNATYLVDATSFEGRRRRARILPRESFEAVRQFFGSRIEQKGITVVNDIPADFRTPPMFPSEVSGIFTNLLSNAVKFTDVGGRIEVTARERGGFCEVQMSNTGVAVDLSRARRFFEAFQSTTERPDAVLGQGMGMGLTITRAFVQEYGGEIDFVAPPPGFATSVCLRIPVR
ncbi:sensor histidine kinase [Rhizobium sp. BK418]|uniref:sensor histidine kinase n=1 Tax=Rhizobium sp. BK418 TaxID=2512120 RepID=UPI00104BD06F|nr:sensor histidine kinase [Rhizobium sp. BK418]TCS09298.1 signal transduction histidine kinase [Rhizobium sp. BK418]